MFFSFFSISYLRKVVTEKKIEKTSYEEDTALYDHDLSTIYISYAIYYIYCTMLLLTESVPILIHEYSGPDVNEIYPKLYRSVGQKWVFVVRVSSILNEHGNRIVFA